MKKRYWIGGIFGALVVFLLILPAFISADFVKQQIISQVEHITGRTLSISGKLSVHFLPFPEMSAEGITLSNPQDWPSAPPFVQAGELKASVKLLPLLTGHVSLKEIELEKPAIYLEVASSGKENWQFAEMAPSAKKPTTARTSSTSNVSASLPDALVIHDGSFTYHDAVKKADWQLSGADIKLGFSGSRKTLDFSASAMLNKHAVSASAKLASFSDLQDYNTTPMSASIKSDLLTAALNGTLTPTSYSGSANVASSSLNDLLAWVSAKPPPSAKEKMPLELEGDMVCGLSKCSITKGSFTFGQIKAHGYIKAQLENAVPQIDINLQTNVLDFGALAGGPDAAAAPSAEAAKPAAGWSTAPIDMSALRAVNFTMLVQSEGILAHGLKTGPALLRAKLEKGVLTGDMTDVSLYDGKATVTVNVNAQSVPVIESTVSMAGVKMQPLLEALTHSGRISGTGNMQMAISSEGHSEEEFVSKLKGNGSVKITDGAIQGLSLADIVHGGKSGSGETMFSQASGTFVIAQGIVTNNDLSMTSPNLNLTGKGTVNLPLRTLNYHLTPQIAGKDKTKAGLGVPIIVEGSLDNPTVRPDAAGAVSDALKDPQAFKDKLKNSKGSVKDLLKGLSQ